MATDATGSPTANFGFPTIAPSADAPSGLGENSIITDVDTKLASNATTLGAVARSIIAKAGSIIGTRRKINFIEGSNVTITVTDDAVGEKVDVTIASSGGATDHGLVTVLPGSPGNGDLCTLTDSLTAPTYSWRLQYVSAKASNKWQCIGGTPARNEVAASETTTSSTYAALTTPGPSITIPVAGNYIVHIEAQCQSSNGSGQTDKMSYDIGGTGAVDADMVQWNNSSGTTQFACGRNKLKTGLAASTALVMKYNTNGGNTGTWSNRVMEVLPVAIGG